MPAETNTDIEHKRAAIKYPNDLMLQRRERGLNRKQTASLIGRSVSSIGRYERGSVLPPLLTALKLEILYRTQLGSLYERLYQALKSELRAKEEAVRAISKPKGGT